MDILPIVGSNERQREQSVDHPLRARMILGESEEDEGTKDETGRTFIHAAAFSAAWVKWRLWYLWDRRISFVSLLCTSLYRRHDPVGRVLFRVKLKYLSVLGWQKNTQSRLVRLSAHRPVILQ